jgi:asparagine synthase (glutamine-hydrolysing)
MCGLIAHRGPDGEGVAVDGPLGLGHRRLAIIDLSPAGRQPMTTTDGDLSVTFNGEIYNFRTLRDTLSRRGHAFRTRTDTEVLLAAYREYGVDCLRHLRGMFAFALYDARTRSLFVARDRAGKKPLFYLLDADGLAFASEVRAFFADPAFSASPDVEAIAHYLAYRYVPSPQSAFAGVRKLPPAHYLLVQDGEVRIERYWRLTYEPKHRLTAEDASEELRTRFRDAVALRMISDVPLGAFLSGGADSSAVVAMMADLSPAPVKTFSIGFEEEHYNELPYARTVAERFGTDHHEFVVRPSVQDIFSKLVWHYGEPYADSSGIAAYCLSELARSHVTVALNGDGGDENFGGYRRYLPGRLRDLYRPLPRAVRALAARAGVDPTLPGSAWRRRLGAVGLSDEELYATRVMDFSTALRARICAPAFLEATASADPFQLMLDVFNASDATDLRDAMMHVDTTYYLPDCLLVKVDIASMAHGLEGRSPMVDHEFMEFAARLPPDLKLRDGHRKIIFKQAMTGIVPAEILHRQKRGFRVPLDVWFRDELRGLVEDVLLSPQSESRGYFAKGAVRQLLDEHVSGRHQWRDQLWNLLMLELWHQTFIDRRPAAPSAGRPVVDLAASTAGG